MSLTRESINKNIPVPLYYQLEETIIKEIEQNNFIEDEPILSELEFCRLLNISRPTVRQAIKDLVNEGYLYKVKGKGTYISKPKINQEFTMLIDSFNDEMSKKGLIPRTKVIQIDIMPAKEEVANSLGIQVGESVINLKRLRFADNSKSNSERYNAPLLYVVTYIPYRLCPELLKINFENESLYKVLEDNNLKVMRVRRTFEARMANTNIAKLLQIEEGEPVHYFETVAYLNNDIPIEFSICNYRGDRNKFIVDIKRT